MNGSDVGVFCLGDLMLHSKYDEIAHEQGTDFVFEKVSSVLREPDILFANLEAVLSDEGEAVYGKLG